MGDALYDEVRRLDDAALAEPLETGEKSLASLVLLVSQEIMHRGGEICLLRDLYRAGGPS